MQYFVPPDGAWSTRTYEFARRLIAKGHQVTVITSNGMLPDPYKKLTKTTSINIAGVPCVVIPVPYATGMSFLARVKGYVRYNLSAFRQITRHRADVVYASSAPLTIAIPALWAKLWHRIPMIFEVRDLWPEMPIAMGALRNPILRWLAKGLEWIAYHAANHVVALSPGMAEGVLQRGVPTDRVSVIPNSCDIALFDVPAECGDPIRTQLGLTPDQPLVVYAGSYGLLNDLEYLVELANHMQAFAPDARFLLIGQGVARERIRAKAEELELLGHTLWMWNPLPKKEMPSLMAAATVMTSFFVPLKPMWKNSANKFFDALAAGKPIVINYGDWQADIIDETGIGLVLPPKDPRKGAEMLAEYLADPTRIEAAGHAAREVARTRFDRDLMAEKLEAIFNQVVKSAKLGG